MISFLNPGSNHALALLIVRVLVRTLAHPLKGPAMSGMYLKLARRNVRRSIKDYSVYFVTLALASCLLYSFTASGDYLLAMDLTEEQRGLYSSASMVMEAFSVFSVLVFVFLVVYANRFILRRRANEFALYGLLGMSSGHTMRILVYESCFVGLLALATGIFLGALFSPLFGAVAAFVFGTPWNFVLTFSGNAALWTCGCFVAIMGGAAVLGTRDIRKRSLLQLMNADRTPEKPRGAGRLSLSVQSALAAIILAFVWGSCILQPVTFIAWILPMGIAAVLATGMIFRVWVVRRSQRAAKKEAHYLRGLRFFVLRQIEAKVSMSANAMGCVCVLLAVAICMIVAGFAFSVGMRTSSVAIVAANALAPIGYVGIFYGMTFLVAAAAVLALQQLAEGTDSIPRYCILAKLGCDKKLMRRAVWSQTGVYFAAPLVFALVHCVFGLALIGFLALTLKSAFFAAISASTIAGVVVLLAIYYLITSRACTKMLIGSGK